METIWRDMLIPGVPVVEKVLRPVFVYAFLVAGLRLAGKRELAQLNPFDLIVLLTLSNTVQNAIIGNDNSVAGGLLGAATLLAVNAFVVRFLYRHERLEQLVEGAPDTLVEDGRVRADRLEREGITLAQIEAAARRQGFASLAEVERAVLEPSGTIAFVARTPSPEAEIIARLERIEGRLATLRPGST